MLADLLALPGDSLAPLSDLLARLAVLCGLAKPTIALLTAVTAAIFCSVILYLHSRVLREEKWALYLGWAFGLFTLQYLLQVIGPYSPAGTFLLPPQQIAQALCSPANNLCILAAARVLLRRSRVLPLPLVVIAFLTASLELAQDNLWSRMPDAIFSLYCLSMFGLSIYRNLPKRRPFLAFFNGILPASYGLLNIVFAFNPLLTAWPQLAGRLHAAALAGASLERVSPLTSLDSLVFAVAFVFKIGLFLGALLLIIKCLTVLSPEPKRDLLSAIASGRGRFLTPQGILHAIGESAEADLVALCIRATGTEKESVVWMRWLRTPVGDKRSTTTPGPLPSSDKSIVAWILREDIPEVAFPDLERDWQRRSWYGFLGLGLTRAELASSRDIQSRYLAYVPGMRSFVAVPIRYHGAVIACLNVEWKEANGFSATTIQRIHQMAVLLAPTVYTRRQVVAIDDLVTRLRSARVHAHDASATVALGRLVAQVHDVLSPLATVCLIELGFRRYAISHHDKGTRLRPSIDDDDRSLRQRIRDLAAVPGSEKQAFRLAKLVAREQNLELGKMALVVQRRRDPAARPSLVTGRLHRRIVAALLTEAALAVLRGELEAALDHLQYELNLSALATAEAWFREIEQAIHQVGLMWVAATSLPPSLETGPLGGPRRLGLVARHEQDLSEAEVQLVPLAEPLEGAHHLLVLRLKNSGTVLWLAVGRRRFGRELEPGSPWREFLLRAAQIADSALVRIGTQRLQLGARGFERVATRVETAGLLMHTLGNEAGVLLKGTQLLEYKMPAVGAPVTPEVRTKIEELKESAEHFKKIANAFRQGVPSDPRTEIPLGEALDKIELLHGEEFRAMGIEVTRSVPADLIVAVPLDAAYIALVTVVVNAAQAIHRNGNISIVAAAANAEDGRVVCEVTDSGPGIRKDLYARIFEHEFSTKPDGLGIGLGLARDSLRRNGGDLILKSGEPGATTFALHLPKPRRAQG